MNGAKDDKRLRARTEGSRHAWFEYWRAELRELRERDAKRDRDGFGMFTLEEVKR